MVEQELHSCFFKGAVFGATGERIIDEALTLRDKRVDKEVRERWRTAILPDWLGDMKRSVEDMCLTDAEKSKINRSLSDAEKGLERGDFGSVVSGVRSAIDTFVPLK